MTLLGLYDDFGHEFTTSVYEQYCTLTSHHDPLLTHRITNFYQYSPLLHNIIYNLETKNELEFLASIEQLKAILTGMQITFSPYILSPHITLTFYPFQQ